MSERGFCSIGEVLSLLHDEFPDVTISKIRFLESQGLIDPERTPSGYRKFYPNDIERLRFILREQKENFLPLKVIKDRLDDAVAGEPVPTPRMPVWMQDRLALADAAAESARPSRPPPARALATGVSLTLDELANASGLDKEGIAELERFGLVSAHRLGVSSYYDEHALVVARLAAGFQRHGIEARHLRMYRTMADREAALFEQVVLPLLKQRNPQARAQANQVLYELTSLGHELRAVALQHALRSYSEGS